MKSKESEAEELAFIFCKEKMLDIFTERENIDNKMYTALGVSKETFNKYYEEIIDNKELLSSTSRTLNIQILLKSSSTLQEFCSKITLYFFMREKVIANFSDPLTTFFKKLLE